MSPPPRPNPISAYQRNPNLRADPDHAWYRCVPVVHGDHGIAVGARAHPLVVPEEAREVALGAEAQLRRDVVYGPQSCSELAHRPLHAQHVLVDARRQGSAAAKEIEEVLARQPHGTRKGLESQVFADAGVHEFDGTADLPIEGSDPGNAL